MINEKKQGKSMFTDLSKYVLNRVFIKAKYCGNRR
jgi:hypothetical protein